MSLAVSQSINTTQPMIAYPGPLKASSIAILSTNFSKTLPTIEKVNNEIKKLKPLQDFKKIMKTGSLSWD